MKTIKLALTLGTALVLCALETFVGAAHAQTAYVVRQPQQRVIITTPVEQPYWDYNIVPRYRYRPEDDRVSPYGPPPVPVIRYGNQEIYVRPWNW